MNLIHDIDEDEKILYKCYCYLTFVKNLPFFNKTYVSWTSY